MAKTKKASTNDNYSMIMSWVDGLEKKAATASGDVSKATENAEDGQQPANDGERNKEHSSDLKAGIGESSVDANPEGMAENLSAPTGQTPELEAKPVGEDPEAEKVSDVMTNASETKDEAAKLASAILTELQAKVAAFSTAKPAVKPAVKTAPTAKVAATVKQSAEEIALDDLLIKAAAEMESNLEDAFKAMGLDGPDGEVKLAAHVVKTANDHADMLAAFLNGMFKSAEEDPALAGDPAAAGMPPMAGPAGPAGAEAPADPAAAGGQDMSPEEMQQVAEEIMKNLSPEEIQELLAMLQSGGAGAGGAEAAPAPEAPSAEVPAEQAKA
jgi:hypothetical protein